LRIKIPLKKNDQFIILSISKTNYRTIIKIIEKVEVLHLMTSINKYLSIFKPKMYLDITVKKLLNHTSGNRFKRAVNSKPNPSFKYNNANYVLLGKIIEKVSGRRICLPN
jgi:CubicO group peptidase (beta-lactamase class C family)